MNKYIYKFRYTFLLVISVLLALMCMCVTIKKNEQNKIIICEVTSNNVIITEDSRIVTNDYIELKNSGSHSCELDGLYLSDDIMNLKKMPLSGLVILPYEYIAIECSGDIDFSVNQNGESIYLSNEDGEIIDSVDVPQLQENQAYSRIGDGEQWGKTICTAAEMNITETEFVDEPVFSHESGFYEDEFELKLSCNSGMTIYYTLDGSIPTEEDLVYSEPICVYDRSEEENVWNSIQNIVYDWNNYSPDLAPVEKAFVVRAMAVNDLGISSKTVTEIYWINKEHYESGLVISLVVEPEDLFGEDDGIYVSGSLYDEWYLSDSSEEMPTPYFRKRGSKWERECMVQFFDDGRQISEQMAGIRIQGESARNKAKKRFSLYARDEYSGDNVFEKDFFEDGVYSHSLLLREKMSDVLVQRLMKGREVAINEGIPCSVFLNGEYWYDVFLREKFDANYFLTHYGVEKDSLICVKHESVDEGEDEDIELYNYIFDYVSQNDMSDESNYFELCDLIDMQSYIDYSCCRIYNVNTDSGDKKNIVMWRSREADGFAYNDGKWRWALYDTDAIEWLKPQDFGADETAAINMYTEGKYAFNNCELSSSLIKNEVFCKQFVNTMMDLINTSFRIENVQKQLVDLGEDVTWNNSFYEKRAEYVIRQTAEEFNLNENLANLKLENNDEEAGSIIVNTIVPEMLNGKWEGKYFVDYPVEVSAVANLGYEFVGWTGDVESEDEKVIINLDEGDNTLKAKFQKIVKDVNK